MKTLPPKPLLHHPGKLDNHCIALDAWYNTSAGRAPPVGNSTAEKYQLSLAEESLL
jgi:hypothetical protein